jgi:hypothetical protein
LAAPAPSLPSRFLLDVFLPTAYKRVSRLDEILRISSIEKQSHGRR